MMAICCAVTVTVDVDVDAALLYTRYIYIHIHIYVLYFMRDCYCLQCAACEGAVAVAPHVAALASGSATRFLVAIMECTNRTWEPCLAISYTRTHTRTRTLYA